MRRRSWGIDTATGFRRLPGHTGPPLELFTSRYALVNVCTKPSFHRMGQTRVMAASQRPAPRPKPRPDRPPGGGWAVQVPAGSHATDDAYPVDACEIRTRLPEGSRNEIGRASCRERV